MENLIELKKAKKYREIIDIYESRPQQSFSLFNLTVILEAYYKLKDFMKAETLANQILEKDPENTFTLKWLGYICFDKKDYENARYLLEKIIFNTGKPFSKDIQILYMVYQKIKQKEKAAQLFEQFKDILKNDAYLKSWYFKEALQQGKTVENITADTAVVQNEYIKYLELKEKIKTKPDTEQIQELEQILLIKSYRANKYILGHLATLYTKGGGYDQAEKIYLELDQISGGKDLFCRKSLGYLYIKMQRYDQGTEILMTLLKEYLAEIPFQKILAKGIAGSEHYQHYVDRISELAEVEPEIKKNYYPLMSQIKKAKKKQ